MLPWNQEFLSAETKLLSAEFKLFVCRFLGGLIIIIINLLGEGFWSFADVHVKQTQMNVLKFKFTSIFLLFTNSLKQPE